MPGDEPGFKEDGRFCSGKGEGLRSQVCNARLSIVGLPQPLDTHPWLPTLVLALRSVSYRLCPYRYYLFRHYTYRCYCTTTQEIVNGFYVVFKTYYRFKESQNVSLCSRDNLKKDSGRSPDQQHKMY